MDNSYLSIAINDYKYAKSIKELGFNNNSVIVCQQVCEKLLKSIAEKITKSSDIMRTHRLKKIYDSLDGAITLSLNSELYLSTLSNFYFDASHPGDDFVNVSDKDAELSYEVMEEVYIAVLDWHNKADTDKIGINLLLDAANKIIGE